MSSRTLYGQHPVSLKIFTSLSGSRPRFFYHDANSVLLVAHLCAAVLIRSMRGTLRSKLFSSTTFDPDANPVLLRAHLCTAVDSMRRKPCVRNCSRKREGLYNGNVRQNVLCAASCVTKDIHISLRFSPAFFYRDVNSVLLVVLIRFYAQNPVFEIVHDESVKAYLHMYNGNVQQNPLCVEPCAIEEISISPRFSSTIFDPDSNSVLLRAHLCTAVDSMRRKPCVRNCSTKDERSMNRTLFSNRCAAESNCRETTVFTCSGTSASQVL